MRTRWTWRLAAVLSVGVAGHALAYALLGDRMYVDVLAESFRERPWSIFVHALIGSVGLAAGPFLLLPSLLARRPHLHRTLGKVYVASAVVIGASGLYLAPYAFGGPVAQAGFAGMGVALLIPTLLAYRAIRAGRVTAHRRWAIMSFAVLFSAVTLRLWLPILVGLHLGDFAPAYRWAAWLSWVPNLAVAAWLTRRPPAVSLPVRRSTP